MIHPPLCLTFLENSDWRLTQADDEDAVAPPKRIHGEEKTLQGRICAVIVGESGGSPLNLFQSPTFNSLA
jgi:hypothetical protein